MRLKFCLWFLFTCALSCVALAQQSENDNAVDSQPMDKAIYFGHLPNGLTYYVRKNVSPKKGQFYTWLRKWVHFRRMPISAAWHILWSIWPLKELQIFRNWN